MRTRACCVLVEGAAPACPCCAACLATASSCCRTCAELPAFPVPPSTPQRCLPRAAAPLVFIPSPCAGRGNDYNLAIEGDCGWAVVEVRPAGQAASAGAACGAASNSGCKRWEQLCTMAHALASTSSQPACPC